MPTEIENQEALVQALYDQGSHNNLRRAALRFTQAVVDNTTTQGRGVLLIEIHRLMLRAMELAQNGGVREIKNPSSSVQDFGDAEDPQAGQVAFQAQAAAVHRAHGNGVSATEF